MKRISVAIDGPAGSGKSTVSGIVADKLGLIHVDTGAMYRAVAYHAIQNGISPSDRDSVIPMLSTLDIKVEYDDEKRQAILIDGVDVMPYIRTPEVSKGASDIAVIPEVRLLLVDIQREIAKKYPVILDGRDIGSYVLPDADFKFFLTGDPKVRAIRRLNEMHSKGLCLDKTLEEMVAEINARDKTDSTRAFAPLTKADDAVSVDTTDMTIGDVVNTIISAITGNGGTL